VSERVSREIVSLPMFPQLTAAQQARVAKAMDEFAVSHAQGELAATEA
jgi:dTDP-4-amino-4,6-dideoxygalactose transaminase